MKYLLTKAVGVLLPLPTKPSHQLISTLPSRSNRQSFLSLLQTCKRADHLYQIHAQAIVSGVIRNAFVATKLVEFIANLRIPGSTCYAFRVVDLIENAHPFTWNTVLRCYMVMGDPLQVIWVYAYMRRKGVQTDSFTAQFLIKACVALSRSCEGKMVHAQVLKVGFNSELIIETAIVQMYGSFGDMDCARQTFDEMTHRDLVSWNAVIAVCAQRGQPMDALWLSSAMLNEAFRANAITVVSMLSACSSLRRLELGKMVHGYVLKSIVDMDVFVYNSLIDMYCRCGQLATARRLFDQMPERNVVSWTSLINGYAEANLDASAVSLFREMESNNVQPDQVAVLGILSACAKSGCCLSAESVHNHVKTKGFADNCIISNAMIDMHAKCGNLGKACQIFDSMRERTIVSWSAMIQGLAIHGLGRAALTRFIQMLGQGFAPDEIVILSVLRGCSHAGMVDEGLECFNSMVKQHGILPNVEHHGCVVDLLCRAGLVSEAFEFVERMPVKPDGVIWRTLLAACKDHGHDALVKKIVSLIFELEPACSGNYVILSNTCATSEQWDGVLELREDMAVRGAIKSNPGCSIIEL